MTPIIKVTVEYKTMSGERRSVRLTREKVEGLGLVICAHCGWPPNNHFSWKPHPCAHDTGCPGFEPKIRGASGRPSVVKKADRQPARKRSR